MPFRMFGRKRSWESLVHGNSEFQANNWLQVFHKEETFFFFISSCSYFISQSASQQCKLGSPSLLYIFFFVFNFWFPSFLLEASSAFASTTLLKVYGFLIHLMRVPSVCQKAHPYCISLLWFSDQDTSGWNTSTLKFLKVFFCQLKNEC